MDKNTLSISDIVKYRIMGMEYKLDAEDMYWNSQPESLQPHINGVGPNWLPEWVLERITYVFEYFLPSTNIHDIDFTFLPKKLSEFKKANKRLRSNMKKQYNFDYKNDTAHLSWWRFGSKAVYKTRKNVRAKEADFLYHMCKEYGESAFMGGGKDA